MNEEIGQAIEQRPLNMSETQSVLRILRMVAELHCLQTFELNRNTAIYSDSRNAVRQARELYELLRNR